MVDLPLLLNCTRCGEFTRWLKEGDGPVVRCSECGKRHSRDSLYLADPGKRYQRDEAGNLLEEPP